MLDQNMTEEKSDQPLPKWLRCMEAGLQHNMGKQWGPTMWSEMTSTPSDSIFVATAESQQSKQRKTEKGKKGKKLR